MVIGPVLGAARIPPEPEALIEPLPPDYADPPIAPNHGPRVRRAQCYDGPQRPFDTLDYMLGFETRRSNRRKLGGLRSRNW